MISVCLFHFQKIPPENFRYPYLYYMAGFLSLQKNERCSMAVTKAILEKWMVAQKRHRLSDKQVQMARELGLNPDKLGKIDNHRRSPGKLRFRSLSKASISSGSSVRNRKRSSL